MSHHERVEVPYKNRPVVGRFATVLGQVSIDARLNVSYFYDVTSKRLEKNCTIYTYSINNRPFLFFYSVRKTGRSIGVFYNCLFVSFLNTFQVEENNSFSV